MRPDWDEYYLGIADAVSRRASCPRASVGAVIVGWRNQIVSTGYNGAPSGVGTCLDEGCDLTVYSHDGKDHCIRSVHAEMNAILWAAKTGVSVTGSTIYVTHEPCDFCARHLYQAGVYTSVYRAGDNVVRETNRRVPTKIRRKK